MKTLIESLLDDENIIFAKIDHHFAKQWIEKNTTGEFKILYLKNGHLKLSKGDLIIKNFEGVTIPDMIKFDTVNGNIYIENCPNLKTIEGLFDLYGKFKGSLNITLCKSLVSLEGLPNYISGNLTVINNKSLKTLPELPIIVSGDACFMKNGKKWAESSLQKHIRIIGRVDCNVDDDNEILESVVNEGLNEPHLLKLAKQLIEDKNGLSFSFIMKNTIPDIKWDEVTSSDVKEYDIFNDEDNALKAIRKIISAKQLGLILIKNNDRYEYVISGDHIWDLNKGGAFNLPYTKIINMVKNKDKAIWVNLHKKPDLNSVGKVSDRYKSREDMVLQGDENYYRQLAKLNIKRYKEIIAQNKLSKNKEYEKLDKVVHETLNRMLAAVAKVHKDPTKYADSMFELAWMQEVIYDQQVYLGWDQKSGQSKYQGQEGLLYCYKGYNKWYMTIHNRKTDWMSVERAEKYLKEYEIKCYDIIDKLNKYYFNKFGV